MKSILSTDAYKQATNNMRGTRLKHAAERVERLVERVDLSAYVLSETLEISTELIEGSFDVPVRRFRLATDEEILIDPSETVAELIGDAVRARAVLGEDGPTVELAVRTKIEEAIFGRVSSASPSPLSIDADVLHRRVLMIQPYGDLIRQCGIQRAHLRGLTATEKKEMFKAVEEASALMTRDAQVFTKIARAVIAEPDRRAPDRATAAYLWLTSRTIMEGGSMIVEHEAIPPNCEYGALRLRGAIASLSRQKEREKQEACLTDHDALAARMVQEFVF